MSKRTTEKLKDATEVATLLFVFIISIVSLVPQ